ncbi:hypothetical protein [Ensifer sp. YR511]|uniref:hypothetical protein n=1 Tax=Ensifer sp. YR511 TaxID=1855294 RepID=UPI001AECAE1C|nr:hypothetical protein [Ensifer sp. YR511]
MERILQVVGLLISLFTLLGTAVVASSVPRDAVMVFSVLLTTGFPVLLGGIIVAALGSMLAEMKRTSRQLKHHSSLLEAMFNQQDTSSKKLRTFDN